LILGNANIPSTFLCCATLHGTGRPRIYLLHVLSKFTPALDGHITPWDNRLLGYLGEVLDRSAMTVVIPSTAFNVVQCPVYNDARFTTEYTNLNDTELFSRIGAAHQDALMIQTRHLMYLPSKYAPLFLSNIGYGVKEALNLFYQAVQSDGFIDPTTPIFTWFRACLHVTQNNSRGLSITTLSLSAPFINEDLMQHRNPLLHNMLPALQDPQDQGLNNAIIQMANAVATQAAEPHNARLAKEIEKDQPVLPSVKFRALFPNLKAYLCVQEETQFPKFWFMLATAPKRQEFSVVHEALDAFSRSQDTFINTAPIPTPKLVADLMTIAFVGDHPDDLKTGLQPFVVMDGSEEYCTAIQDIAGTTHY